MPVIVTPHTDIAAITTDLLQVYADFPGHTAPACLAAINTALLAGGLFYAGLFNGRQVAGALVTGLAEQRHLSLIAVRTATRQRGVGSHLLNEISRLERAAGTSMLAVHANTMPNTVQIARLLKHTGFAPIPDQATLLGKTL